MRITEQKCDCSFKIMPITDYSETSTLYYPTWEDSGVVTLIYKINNDGSETLIDYNLAIHVRDNKPQREVYELYDITDGWYKVRSYILPTKSFLEELGMINSYDDIKYQLFWKQENEDNMFRKNYNMTIAVDENVTTGIVFQGRTDNPSPYKAGALFQWLECEDVNDFIEEVQNRGIEDGFVYGTNIRVIEEDFFTICHLYKCFLNKAQSLLDQYKGCTDGKGFSLCNGSKYSVKCKSGVDQVEIQIRDYLWMVINAIKYAVECEDYQHALKLLNCISSCSGICDGQQVKKSDCGCS